MPKNLSSRGEEDQERTKAAEAGTCHSHSSQQLCNNNSSQQLCNNNSSQQLCSNSSSQLCSGYLTLPRSKVMSDNILITSPKTKVRILSNFPIQCSLNTVQYRYCLYLLRLKQEMELGIKVTPIDQVIM